MNDKIDDESTEEDDAIVAGSCESQIEKLVAGEKDGVDSRVL